jgi:hypothetical protein
MRGAVFQRQFVENVSCHLRASFAGENVCWQIPWKFASIDHGSNQGHVARSLLLVFEFIHASLSRRLDIWSSKKGKKKD